MWNKRIADNIENGPTLWNLCYLYHIVLYNAAKLSTKYEVLLGAQQ